MRSIVPPPAPGLASAEWSKELPGALEVRFSGATDGLAVRHVLATVRAETERRRPRAMFCDATGIGPIAPDVREPSVDLMRYVRSLGIERWIVITDSSTARMLGSAFAMASGLVIEFVASREQAHARLRAVLGP